MNRRGILYCSLLVINALVIYSFIFYRGVIPLGWDTQFHLNRIEELYQSFWRGHLLSSTGTFAFSQIGLPINVFYPYLFLYPFAILRGMLNPVVGYNCGLFIFTLISFFISYYSISKISHDKKKGFLFSLLYNNSGYFLLQITYRGDIAEYIALSFLPLIFMGFEMMYQSGGKEWLFMPLGLTLVAYDHLLSVLIFSLFLFCFFITRLDQLKLFIIKRIGISICIVAVAISPLLISILSIKLKAKIIIPIVPDTLINEALMPSDLFLNSLNNIGPSTLSTVNIGFLSLIAGVYGILSYKTKRPIAIWMETFGLFFLLMTTKLFPWFLVQKTVISNIQFPWRFLGITTFCFAYVAAELFCDVRIKMGSYCLFFFISLVSFGFIHQYANNMRGESLMFNNIKEYKKVATNAVYTDYMPSQTLAGMNKAQVFRSQLDIHKHIAVINDKKVQLSNNNIKLGYNSIEYKIKGLKRNKTNTVILPVLNYGRNTSNVGKSFVASNGETLVKLSPQDSSQTVIIRVKSS